MNKEIKDKWVAALESGEYEQGVMSLFDKTERTYCCLGVLRSVCRKEGIRLPKDESDEFLEPKVCERKTGLTYEEQTTLWRMNDDDEKSFREIAGYIRENL